jgi:hypothetical protein
MATSSRSGAAPPAASGARPAVRRRGQSACPRERARGSASSMIGVRHRRTASFWNSTALRNARPVRTIAPRRAHRAHRPRHRRDFCAHHGTFRGEHAHSFQPPPIESGRRSLAPAQRPSGPVKSRFPAQMLAGAGTWSAARDAAPRTRHMPHRAGTTTAPRVPTPHGPMPTPFGRCPRSISDAHAALQSAGAPRPRHRLRFARRRSARADAAPCQTHAPRSAAGTRVAFPRTADAAGASADEHPLKAAATTRPPRGTAAGRTV